VSQETELNVFSMKEENPQPSRRVTSPHKKKALESAIRILTRRDHTEKELLFKLRLRKFDAAEIEDALNRCREFGYLDDARTAAGMAKQMAARGNGPLKIRHTLEQKGVDDLSIQQALSLCGNENDQVKSAQYIMKRIRFRLYRESDSQKRRAIAYRFLTGRGFTLDVIKRATIDL
jgi:regulatory protein